jgi:uncharacterized protein YjlB
MEQASQKLTDDGEYNLEAGEGVWITIGTGSLRVKHSHDGVICTLYRAGSEMDNEIDEMAVLWSEIEPWEGSE